jgi:hypothetical protein
MVSKSVDVHVQIMLKSAEAEDIETRVRRCQLASALVAFSQGVAFFHAGDEILRSKSLDRDSYNSGHPLTQHVHCVTPLHASLSGKESRAAISTALVTR